ncbi:MAG TPA: DUF2461 domain-containing protein [Thermoanaerobaculia bacterium]|jgi:uncharacterized protein (TIGR02453 family)|nr:DUF2461 domain-containing protein [Thermoanaerobaculia bacterium]
MTPEVFRFLNELRENNDREWFQANKERYEKKVREPILRFISDVGPRLQKISGAIVADPRPSGGSLFRIHRDTRFSKDKSPYKTHIGVHFFHESAKKSPSVPGFYLHIMPTESFIASGIWRPEPAALARIRDSIAGGSAEWKAFRKSKLVIEGDSLKRPPRGYAADHPDLEHLKRTDFVTSVQVSNKEMCSDDFLKTFADECRRMAPLVKFVSRSLDLTW